MSNRILVLGGNGKTGRRVAERLTAQGIEVRIGSRSATPSFDWYDDSTWAAALDGIDMAYVSFFPDLAMRGRAGDHRRVRAAGRAGRRQAARAALRPRRARGRSAPSRS